MSGLFDYLDVGRPEYAYLGHFKNRVFLEQGHNDDGTYDVGFDRLAGRVGPQNDQPTVPGFKLNPNPGNAFTPFDPDSIGPYNRSPGNS